MEKALEADERNVRPGALSTAFCRQERIGGRIARSGVLSMRIWHFGRHDFATRGRLFFRCEIGRRFAGGHGTPLAGVPRFGRSCGQERHAACGALCGRALPWRGGDRAASAAAWRAGSIDLMEHRNAVRRGCYHGWPANGAGRIHGRLRRRQAERASRRSGRAFGKTAAGCRKSAGLSARVGRWTVREGRCI